MTMHLKPVPTAAELVRSTEQKPAESPTRLKLVHLFLLPFVYFGGGDRRAFERSAANVLLLSSLGIINFVVTSASAALLGISIIGFFALENRAVIAALVGASAFGVTTLFVNAAIMHSQFEAHGARQLMRIRPSKTPLPKLAASNWGVVVLRMIIAAVFAASLALPTKLSLTKIDQTAEINNERNQKNSRQARSAREAVDSKLRLAGEQLRSSHDEVSALALEKSIIDVGQLGGDVPTPPPNLVNQISPEILALARHAADLHRRQRQVTADRDAELALARQHDQDARAFRRQQNGARAAWAAERRRNAAQQRANVLNGQLQAVEADLTKTRAQLDVHRNAAALRLEHAQRTHRDNERRLRELEASRDQDIVQRTQTGDGYRQYSEGIIGRVEALFRLVMKSEAARWTLAGIVLLLLAWDLLPLLSKLAVKLPAYSLRIARENHEAYASEARAVAAADAELMRIASQADTELSAFRKDQRQRILEWYERFPPIWLVRLRSWFGLRPFDEPTGKSAPDSRRTKESSFN